MSRAHRAGRRARQQAMKWARRINRSMRSRKKARRVYYGRV